MRRIAIIGLLAFTAASHADDKETDRILRNVYTAKEVDGAKFKYADLKNGVYGYAGKAEILADGRLSLSGGGSMLQKLVMKPNGGEVLMLQHACCGGCVIMTFDRPLKTLDDLNGNRLRMLGQGDGFTAKFDTRP